MLFEDKVLTCKECGVEFVFTVGEQEFYAEKGFQHSRPMPECRRRRKAESRGGSGEREMFDVICDECGVETKVPFRQRRSTSLLQ